MALPRLGNSEKGSMFEGLKSRLGFPSNPPQDEYGDGGYDDSYENDYQEFSPYGGYDDRSSGRAPSPPVRQQPTRGQASGPHLVSFEDVRANLPDSLNRNPIPERNAGSVQGASSYQPRSGYRSNSSSFPRKIEKASDYMISTDTSDLPLDTGAGKSPGSSPAYSSNRPMPQSAYASSSTYPSSSAYPSSGTVARPQEKPFDPFETYEGGGIVTHNPSRTLNILRPASYSEVERIAKIIRAGDVVVLCLRNTPDQLAKRILDFSFGVSSALDATVDCIADKVFVIIHGRALGEDEFVSLQQQGAFL